MKIILIIVIAIAVVVGWAIRDFIFNQTRK